MKLNYFNFKPFEGDVLLTNDFGEYVFVKDAEFQDLIHHRVQSDSPLGKRLLDHHIIYEESELSFSDRCSYRLRDVKNHLSLSTSLHIFVVTTACNLGCVYCQANNGHKYSNLYMSTDVAEKAVDIALQSPTRDITFEFQGGEPLLNIDVVRHIVEYAESKKGNHRIKYSIVTNLTMLDAEEVQFFKQYNVDVSTSIDGPELVHNINRPYKDGSPSYRCVADKLELLRKEGIRVGAIQTTTKASLEFPNEIVDAYYRLGFDSIFIRPLTPLGRASLGWEEIGYTPEQFLDFYRKALHAVLRINNDGHFFREDHANILLKRISGYSVNYMELRSPCGAGIGQMAYYPDGNIFTCDEGRMLYEMGDDAFCMGTADTADYRSLVSGTVCKTAAASSCLETIPGCCDCVYQPYCGVCPVIAYATSNDVIEKQPFNYRCKIYSGILDELFSILHSGDTNSIEIFNSWRN